MRVLVFIGAVVTANVVTIGGVALLVLLSPDLAQGVIWLPVSALLVVVYGPLLVGAVLTTWDPAASSANRRHVRRWLVVSFAGQALGVVAVVVFSAIGAGPAWLPLPFLVVAAALDLAAVRVGPALRRREEARWRDAPWQPVARTDVLRRVLIVAGVFVAALVVGSIAALLLAPPADRGGAAGSGVLGVLFALSFAFLAAAIATIVVSLRLGRMLRTQVGRDVGELRTVAKAVLRGRSVPLGPEERAVAAKYAVVVSVVLPFNFAYVTLLYAGLAVQQVAQMILEPDRVFPKVFLAVMVAVLVVLLPLFVVRIRRARAYARTHADELPAVARDDAASDGRPS